MLGNDEVPGFHAPVHRALTEPILLGGAPRTIANGTLAAAIGLGLQLWVAGAVIGFIGHIAAVWAAKRDPLFVEVGRRHIRYPARMQRRILRVGCRQQRLTAASGVEAAVLGVRGFEPKWRARHDSNVRPPPSESLEIQ